MQRKIMMLVHVFFQGGKRAFENLCITRSIDNVSKQEQSKTG
jgi:hypothetical protein